MNTRLILLCFATLISTGIFAQKNWKPEEYKSSTGKAIMVYPNGNTVTKESYDLAVRLCEEAEGQYQAEGYEAMKKSAEKAIKADPNFWRGYVYLGVYFNLKSEYQKAIDYYKLAIQFSFDQEFLLKNIARNYNDLSNYDEAIKFAQKSVEANPSYSEAYSQLSFALGRKEKYNEALSAGKKALSLGSKGASTLNNIGYYLKMLGDYEEARKYYLQAIEVDPNYQTAENNLAELEKIAPSSPGTVWIISVGVNRYRNNYMLSDLSFPTKGAYELARIFENRNMLKEQAEILTDSEATRSNILGALDRLHNSGKVKYNDMVLFYFSGHGEMAGNRIGICPYDYSAPRDLISDGEISKKLNRLVAKHKIAIVEACKTEVETAAPIPAAALAKYNESRRNLSGGLAYVTSTRAGMVSYGNTQGGYFSLHLQRALSTSVADTNGDKVISLKEVFDYTRKQTSNQTNGKQVPEINKSGFDLNMPIMILN